jgi:alkyl sulfatase BDS1-like metallo-beta-lactamase superfamily hydrolase
MTTLPNMSDQIFSTESGTRLSKSLMDCFIRQQKGFEKCEAKISLNLYKVCDRIHVVAGLSIVNCICIESETGLIIMDTGNIIGQGKEMLENVRKVSDRPIKAIIYSHHHYTGGAKAFVDDNPDGECTIYGHPKLEPNRKDAFLGFGRMQALRGGRQVGAYLPEDGADAAIGMTEPRYEDPELNKSGHLRATHDVADGEEVIIDGLKAIFHHVVSDADDSLAVWFPELDAIFHNAALTGFLHPFYTLRGEYYRDPEAAIRGIDLMRDIKPNYVVGVHGAPLVGREEAYQSMTRLRDGYAYALQQSIRAINGGKSPDEMVRDIKLPDHLKNEPLLYEGYIRFEYAIRGFFRGMVGWFANDTADLSPPPPESLAREIVDGFGGPAEVIARCQTLFEKQGFKLAAKLVTYVLQVDADNDQARQLKADSLRMMAQLSPDIQSRHFYISHALDLERKIDLSGPPAVKFFGEQGIDNILNTRPGTVIRLLENLINPELSLNIEKTLTIIFTDLDLPFSLTVRKGVVEITENAADNPDICLDLPRPVWLAIYFRATTFQEALDKGEAVLSAGDIENLLSFMALFDRFKKR